MTNGERTQWLSALNVGDEVSYTRGGIYRGYVIAKITRISPTRRFSLSDGSTVNSDGSIRGDKYFYIHPVTEKIRTSIWRNRAIVKIRNGLKIEKLSNDELKTLLKMLDA